MNKIEKIAVFCGAKMGNNPIYREAAEQFASILVQEDITLVYGGGNIGLMGVIADAVLAQGGKAIGVIPQRLVDVEVSHEGLTEQHIVNSMHERKALMAELADAFVMLPGGAGSLDEFFEAFTWGQLNYHDKPCAILNVNHYYDQIIRLLDHMEQEGFLKNQHRNMILIDESPLALLSKCRNYQAPTAKKWE